MYVRVAQRITTNPMRHHVVVSVGGREGEGGRGRERGGRREGEREGE